MSSTNGNHNGNGHQNGNGRKPNGQFDKGHAVPFDVRAKSRGLSEATQYAGYLELPDKQANQKRSIVVLDRIYEACKAGDMNACRMFLDRVWPATQKHEVADLREAARMTDELFQRLRAVVN